MSSSQDFYTSDRLKDMINNGRAFVGKYSYGNVLIQGKISRLYMGKFCSIAGGVTIFLGNEHNTKRVTTYPFCAISQMEKANMDWGVRRTHGHPISKGDVHIGNDVWIGQRATILSGVSIGDGAVVGAESLVTKNVKPYSVVGGNPARFLKWRFPESIRQALLRIKWWEWDDEAIKDAASMLCNEDIVAFIAKYDPRPILLSRKQKLVLWFVTPMVKKLASTAKFQRFQENPAAFFQSLKSRKYRIFGSVFFPL